MRRFYLRPFNPEMNRAGLLLTATQRLEAKDLAIIGGNNPVATANLNY